MASQWLRQEEEYEPGLLPVPERRYLALTLPRWATDCLKRADPTLASLTRPLVLWEKQKGAMRVVALDLAASAAGLFIGQSLSDARAICPILEAREIDQQAIEQLFADFADWHSNATPLVGLMTDRAPYGDLVLDITGASHLLGGESAMLEHLTQRLIELGFSVQGAIAPTIGAAWALAHFNPGTIVAETRSALADLPVAALRLDEAQIMSLNQMGLKQVGQLYSRSRQSLTARFGPGFTLRLDQALGLVNERLVPRLPLIDYYTERRFAEPIGLMDDVLMTTRDLALQLSGRLEQAGLGAQTFHMFLYRTDHKLISMSVNAARATRDALHIARLFIHRSERLGGEYDAGFGIDMIRLAASSLSELAAEQTGAFETAGADDLDKLYDRMASRLGPQAVLRSKFVNSHIPERAVVLEPVVARTEDDPNAAPNPLLRRPLRLLPSPEPITVALAEVPDGPPPNMVWRRVTYRFVKASGPERIAAEWWSVPAMLQLTAASIEAAQAPGAETSFYEEGRITRDYFIAEDDGGRRFWIFREGLFGVATEPKWFLHGFFS
jgi:protein ImuB